MKWEYERKEINDKRLDAFLTEKGEEGWELVHAHRGLERRAGKDPDAWEVILKRPKTDGSRESKGLSQNL